MWDKYGGWGNEEVWRKEKKKMEAKKIRRNKLNWSRRDQSYKN